MNLFLQLFTLLFYPMIGYMIVTAIYSILSAEDWHEATQHWTMLNCISIPLLVYIYLIMEMFG